MASDRAGPGLPWRSLCGSVGRYHAPADLMRCRGFPAGGDGHAYAIRADPGAGGPPAGAPGARQPAGGSALRARAGAGGGGRGGGGQVRAAGVRGRGGAGSAGGPGRGGGIGDGAGVRRRSPAVRAAAGSPGAAAGPAARRGGGRGRAAPDRFLVGLAVLTLLSEAAEDRPLLCLVDDAQWLDRASGQVLGFVARRLLADPVGLLFAARDPGEELRGLPDLEVRGLREEDARGLLRSVVRVRLDERVRDRIVAETQGNPLALLELPRGLSPAQLAGGFGLAGAQAVPGRIEESFRRRLEALPAGTRLLLLVAAAGPVGDPALVRRAAERLGVAAAAAAAAEADGLVEIGARVRFRHPLVRSAV